MEKLDKILAGAVVLVVGVVCGSVFGQYGGGSGTEGDPYLINTPGQMQAIGANQGDWDNHFRLMADINLSGYPGTSFNIIGYYLSGDNPFTGVFDGNGHTISNFTYDASGLSYPDNYTIGLFGYIAGDSAEVKDLGLINAEVDAGTGGEVGSLVGWLWEGGTVSGCYAEGGSVSGWDVVGGLVGGSGFATISGCYSTASVSGDWKVGGLVGMNSSTITDCYSTGSVSGNDAVGGLVGVNIGNTIITNCYATGSVSASRRVGGLVGSNGSVPHGSNGGMIANCYSTGSVSGDESVGGLVGLNHRGWSVILRCYSAGRVLGTTNVGGLLGLNDGGTVTASFWDKQNSGRSNMCGGQVGSASGCDDGNGKTTAEMQDINTFLAAGWDFVGEYTSGPSDDWAEPPGGGYMILWWQLDPLPPLPTFPGGAGTESEPYLISNATDLNRIGHNPRLMDKHFKVTDDIDLSGSDIWSIGNKAFPFAGVFDGNGHTVSNFTYDASGLSWADNSYIGLLRHVDGPSAEIKDLGLIDPNVKSGQGDYVGSLVGYIGNGTISGCYVEGGSLAGQYGVGGLVGYNNSGTITHCYSTGSVSGSGGWSGTFNSGVGGLVGNNDGTITNCYSAGSVSGTGSDIGGLVGLNRGTISDSNSAGSVSGGDSVGGLAGYGGTIINCYSTAGVFGNDYVGGLSGDAGLTSNCYATGNVTGSTYVGGLLGRNRRGTVTTCYSAGNVSGFSSVGGLVGENYRRAISDCYALGDATGLESVGGLVGKNLTYVNFAGDRYYGTITNCYSVGAVTAFIGDTDIGGLVGLNDGQVTGSLWDAETSGRSNMCGSQGAEGSGCDNANGKTTVQMQTESTFTSGGWDFANVWNIDEGKSYPRFQWDHPVGDFDLDKDVDLPDFGIFSAAWLSTPADPNSWNPVCDLYDPNETPPYPEYVLDPNDVIIDVLDLEIFSEHWLEGTAE